MLPDRVSNLGPLTYESGALPIALRGPALATRAPTTYGMKVFDRLSKSQIALRLHHEHIS